MLNNFHTCEGVSHNNSGYDSGYDSGYLRYSLQLQRTLFIRIITCSAIHIWSFSTLIRDTIRDTIRDQCDNQGAHIW